MRTKLIWSVLACCALGCAPEGDAVRADPLSNQETPDEPMAGCEEICPSYDPTECRVVCPPAPPDASIPEDPYAGDPSPEPPPIPAPAAPDAGGTPEEPHDPYAE